jgi:hypothetical protein
MPAAARSRINRPARLTGRPPRVQNRGVVSSSSAPELFEIRDQDGLRPGREGRGSGLAGLGAVDCEEGADGITADLC